MTLRIGDFELAGGRVYLRKTGNSAVIDRRLVAEIAIWIGYHLIVRARGLLAYATLRPRRAIWFTPDVPHPRYMVRTAAIWGGIRIAASPGDADASFFFDDTTTSRAPLSRARPGFNFRCSDISKTRVARVFEDVFGYPLLVDPSTWSGLAVEKSERNGAHDGRIISCPSARLPGKSYQRLIDTVDEDGRAQDLRTHCIDGIPILVWRKKRIVENRFEAANLEVSQHEPHAIFSSQEIASIRRFNAAMGLDWGGLDILRDRSNGRIYIVDVNKTDAGPIIALPLRWKLSATAILSRALLAMVDRSKVAT